VPEVRFQPGGPAQGLHRGHGDFRIYLVPLRLDYTNQRGRARPDGEEFVPGLLDQFVAVGEDQSAGSGGGFEKRFNKSRHNNGFARAGGVYHQGTENAALFRGVYLINTFLLIRT